MLLKRLAALALAFALAGAAQNPSPEADELDSMEARGSVGPYRIGLNYTVRQHVELVTAHYFYVSRLRDIPLKGVVRGEYVELDGEDGSTFHLHFVGNGSNGKEPLTFYNSIGLNGSWTLRRRIQRIRERACMRKSQISQMRLMKRWSQRSKTQSLTGTRPN